MALLTDRTLAQSSAITPTTLIHIVTTADTSQNSAGSSYKAELGQLIPIFSAASDTFVTGFTYTANTFTIFDNLGNEYSATINSVTGLTINGNLTVTGDTTLNGLTATTLSATTYLGLPLDVFVTGGTYSAGTITFTNNSGDTFPVTGITLTFTGGSGNCVTDLYVDNLHACGTEITVHNSVQSTGSTAAGILSFAFGTGNTASGNYSHAEGWFTLASGIGSHSEGGIQSGLYGPYTGGTALGNGSHAEGTWTLASGDTSHAEGWDTKSTGWGSHAEGESTESGGDSSHSEGIQTKSMAYGSHSEGYKTSADTFAYYSHAEGEETLTFGEGSHSEGYQTTAYTQYSHAEGQSSKTGGVAFNAGWSHSEGYGTVTGENFLFTIPISFDPDLADGYCSHSEGYITSAYGGGSHAEGLGTKSQGKASHSEGRETLSFGIYSHSEGYLTTSTGWASHSEGSGTTSYGNYSHSEGFGTITSGESSHAEGSYTFSTGIASHSEGFNTNSIGIYSHSEGESTVSSGQSSHSEGYKTIALGDVSHTEGSFTFAGYIVNTPEPINSATGNSAHAEGYYTLAEGAYSHSEGIGAFGTKLNKPVKAIGIGSHAEGRSTIASGTASHSEGNETIAGGDFSHAEGLLTETRHLYSHTAGWGTLSTNDYQFVVGKFNEDKPAAIASFIIGNGTTSLSRSDLMVAGASQVSIFGTLDVSGLTRTDTFILRTNPFNGYVLVSDGIGNGTWQPLSAVTGSSVTSVTGVTTSAFTADTSYEYYGVEYTGTTNIEIPSASGLNGFTIRFKDERGTAATYPITITPVTGNIDGNPSVTMAINYMSLTMVARNNNWWII